MFIGRDPELHLLDKLFRSPSAELFILYGRRRVGKTELLNQYAKGKRHVHFIASQTEITDNIQQLVDLCVRSLPDSFIDFGFNSIEGVLSQLTQAAGEEKMIVVLDEFQYLVQSDPSIPSQLQRFWDRLGRKSNLLLVLCGSYISLMVEHALAERSPLYGRRTAQLQLMPLDFRTACKFFPRWKPRESLQAYAVLGGMPAYLRQFDPGATLAANIVERIVSKGTFLSEEAGFLLKTELRETLTYASILKAIARGCTTLKDIASRLGMDGRSISYYLSTLQNLNLIRREVSMGEGAPEKSRKGLYVITDNFLRFWFNFVEPYTTLVELNRGAELFSEIIKPAMDTFVEPAFEEMCRQYVLLYGQETGLPLAMRVGRIWGRDFDLDVVAENLDGSLTIGECKWSSTPIDPGMFYRLREQEQRSVPHSQAGTRHYVLFSAGGFKTRRAPVDAKLVSAVTMLG